MTLLEAIKATGVALRTKNDGFVAAITIAQSPTTVKSPGDFIIHSAFVLIDEDNDRLHEDGSNMNESTLIDAIQSLHAYAKSPQGLLDGELTYRTKGCGGENDIGIWDTGGSVFIRRDGCSFYINGKYEGTTKDLGDDRKAN